MMPAVVDDTGFVEAVALRAGLPLLAAIRVTHSVLRSLAERLTRPEAMAIAGELSPALGDVVLHGSRSERFDLHELVLRVQARTGSSRELALQYIAVVCMTLCEHVSDATLAPLRQALPPPIAFLLRPPPGFEAREPSAAH